MFAHVCRVLGPCRRKVGVVMKLHAGDNNDDCHTMIIAVSGGRFPTPQHMVTLKKTCIERVSACEGRLKVVGFGGSHIVLHMEVTTRVVTATLGKYLD